MTRLARRFYLELGFLALLAIAILVPLSAMAQGEAPPVTVEPMPLLASILAVAVPLLLTVARFFWKDKTEARMKMVTMGIEIAYHATTNIAKFTSTTVDDKIAVALSQLRTFLAANGYALTPEIESQAKVTWGAMHAQEKLALGLGASPRP